MSVGKTDFASHPLGMGRVLAVLLERLFDQQTAQTAANALFLYAEYDRTRYNKVQEICALAMDCMWAHGPGVKSLIAFLQAFKREHGLYTIPAEKRN